MALVSWYPPGQTLIPWRQHMGVVGADSYADRMETNPTENIQESCHFDERNPSNGFRDNL